MADVAARSLPGSVNSTSTDAPNHGKACFSFAAYARSVVKHLHKCQIRVSDGLSEEELTGLEHRFGFLFPPDLRTILQEGLPVGDSFPNWRSAFWKENKKKEENEKEEEKDLIEMVNQPMVQFPFDLAIPKLVPLCRHCYVPSSPNLAGNPVFFIHQSRVFYCGYDLAGFFARLPFVGISANPSLISPHFLSTPPWAAKSPRKIEFWSDLAQDLDDDRNNTNSIEIIPLAKNPTSCSPNNSKATSENYAMVELGLNNCSNYYTSFLNDVAAQLRKGGWPKEDIDEMILVTPCSISIQNGGNSIGFNIHDLAICLKEAGWSHEDVFEALNLDNNIRNLAT